MPELKMEPVVDAVRYAFSAAAGLTPSWEEDRYRFFLSARTGNVRKLKEVAAKYPECLGWRTENGSAAEIALHCGNLKSFTALLDLGTPVDEITDQYRGTLLFQAVKIDGREKFVASLLDHGADPRNRMQMPEGEHLFLFTPLALAIDNENKPAVALLLARGTAHSDPCAIWRDPDTAAESSTMAPWSYATHRKKYEVADFILGKTYAIEAPPAENNSVALDSSVQVGAPLRLKLKT